MKKKASHSSTTFFSFFICSNAHLNQCSKNKYCFIFLLSSYFRCFVDCSAVVSASNKLRVTSECLNSPCNGSVYEWRLKRLNENSNISEDIPILPNMTSTAVNATNMIIKKDALQSKSKYSLTLFVTSPEGAEGFAVLDFETAAAPHSGYCASSASEGVSLETEFTFKCFDWQDTNALTYEFQLGEEPISYGSSPESVSTVLPTGSPEDDYQLQINIVVKNYVGVAVVFSLMIKVTSPLLVFYYYYLRNLKVSLFKVQITFASR